MLTFLDNNNGEQNLSWNVYYYYSFSLIQNSTSLAKNADFECWYIRTHTEENPSKMFNITFAILPFSHKDTLN